MYPSFINQLKFLELKNESDTVMVAGLSVVNREEPETCLQRASDPLRKPEGSRKL